MKFRKIITKVWKLTTKHKVLWLFAALAFAASLPGILLVLVGRTTVTRDEFYFLRCFAGLISLITVPLSTAGLIKGFQKANSGRRVRFRPVFNEARRFYWRLLLLPLLIGLLFVPVYITFRFFMTLSSAAVDSLICIVPWILLFIPVLLFFVATFLIANISLVTENLRLGEALSRATQIIRANLKSIAGMLLIYSVLAFPLGWGLSFIYSSATSSASVESLGSFAIVLISLLYYGVLCFLTTLYQGFWILSYLQLKKPVAPKKRRS